MACLGITEKMRTAPTAVMEVLLGFPPLHLQVDVEAKIETTDYVVMLNGKQN
jgi:hypothetical protein